MAIGAAPIFASMSSQDSTLSDGGIVDLPFYACAEAFGEYFHIQQLLAPVINRESRGKSRNRAILAMPGGNSGGRVATLQVGVTHQLHQSP